MAEKVVKTVKVSESTADEWETYVRDSAHIDSLSHLIRLAVHNEVNGAPEAKRETSPSEESSMNGEVLTHLKQIETDLRDIATDLEIMKRTEAADRNYNLKRAVFTALPLAADEVDLKPNVNSSSGGYVYSRSEPTSEKIGHMTAEEVAVRLGADEEKVSQILDELCAESSDVDRIVGTGEGTPIYYRSG